MSASFKPQQIAGAPPQKEHSPLDGLRPALRAPFREPLRIRAVLAGEAACMDERFVGGSHDESMGDDFASQQGL